MYISASTAATIAAITFISIPLASSTVLTAQDEKVQALKRDGDSQMQRWSSLIGIITAIVGNVLISFALNIQRYAHIRLHQERRTRRQTWRKASNRAKNGYGTTSTENSRQDSDQSEDFPEHDERDPLMRSFTSQDSRLSEVSDAEDVRTTYLKSPYWWAGIVLMTIGETGNFLAYGFAPASIVSPLGVVALISNCVIAPFMLKETFRWRDFWGVLVAIGGAVTVVLSAKQEEKKLGPHEVIGAITTTAFEVYMGVTIALIASLMWASPKYGSRTSLIDLGLVGLFGGYTALSTKGVASMLSFTLWKAFTTPITYVLVAILVGTAVMQVRYVNKALQRFDSTQVIPVQFVLFTLSVIIGSAVLYRDFEKTTPERASKFIGGCLLTFLGVFLITSGRSSRDEDYDADSDEEAGVTINLPHHDKINHNNTPRPLTSSTSHVGDGSSAEPDAARRLSHVSFLPKDARPETPRMVSEISRTQSITLTPSANNSTSSTEESDSFTSNPWRSSTDEQLAARQHPGMPSIITTPLLPSEAQVQHESLPSIPLTRSISQTDPHTHPNLQHAPTPPAPDVLLERPSYSRHSLTRSIFPGPYISPLSAPLSAIVIDNMRRGVDSPSRISGSLRRARRLRKSKSQRMGSESGAEDEDYESSPRQHHHSVDDGTERRHSMLSRSLGADLEVGKRSRTRSLSNALGGFFSIRKKKLENEDAEDSDGGPSNQV